MSGLALAMWSGPRNISTAMMRAWQNRSDTQVIDEPFYAHYLAHTGIDHPMASEVIAQGETDWDRIVARLTDIPDKGVLYQKHITTHWLDHFRTEWLSHLSHVFLIREPTRVVASYANKRQSLTVEDLGYEKQLSLFRLIETTIGHAPVVIDSHQFLLNPSGHLERLCQGLGISFEQSMLHWDAGSRESDGIWGQHWYDSVNRSTGFGTPSAGQPTLTDEQLVIVQQCQPYYDELSSYVLKAH